MWKAAFKPPLSKNTGPASLQDQATPAVCWHGALDVQEGTSFTGLHGASDLA